MPIKRFTPIFQETRRQFSNEIVTAGLAEGEQREMELINKVAAVISDFMEAGMNAGRPGVAVMGAFRVMFSTVEALAQQIDEVIDEHEQACGCDGTGAGGKNDPNNNGGLLH